MLTQNILTQPTFDLIDWSILSYNSTDKILFCQSNQVFRFDKCKGTVMPSDLVLKANTCYNQSRLVKNIIGTVIQAGFCGNLNFKIELTDDAVKEISKMRIPFEENLNKRDKKGFDMKEILNKNSLTASRVFKTIIQIDLNPFPNNYYSGTNQTELEPDVFFTSGNSPMEINNEDFMKGFYLGNSEKERFEAEIKLDNPEAEIKLLRREVEIAAASVGFGPKNKTIFNEIKTFEVDYPN